MLQWFHNYFDIIVKSRKKQIFINNYGINSNEIVNLRKFYPKKL